MITHLKLLVGRHHRRSLKNFSHSQPPTKQKHSYGYRGNDEGFLVWRLDANPNQNQHSKNGNDCEYFEGSFL